MARPNPDDVVTLTTAQNPAEAHVIEQALRQAGIRCQVVGDYLDAGIGDIPGVRPEVLVHRDDLAAAQEALREARESAGQAEDAAGPEA